VLIKIENGQYLVRLGTMGEQANKDVIYKPRWFYTHLPAVNGRVLASHVVGELNPVHQGRDERKLRTINGMNAFGLFTHIGTDQAVGESDIHIVGRLKLAGPNAHLVQAMLLNDPGGSSWAFQMRSQVRREEGRRLVPIVEKVITWDLHSYN
jgi:hypothetical protein